MRRALVLAAATLAVALAPAAEAGPVPMESCQPGRTQVLCQSGRCDPEGGCVVYPCVLWVKNFCVPFG